MGFKKRTLIMWCTASLCTSDFLPQKSIHLGDFCNHNYPLRQTSYFVAIILPHYSRLFNRKDRRTDAAVLTKVPKRCRFSAPGQFENITILEFMRISRFDFLQSSRYHRSCHFCVMTHCPCRQMMFQSRRSYVSCSADLMLRVPRWSVLIYQ